MSSSQLLRSNGTLLFASDARRQLAAGEPLRAIETCKRGLARHPDHAAGYVVLAAAYRSIGESGRARLVLRRGFERTGLARLRDLAEEIPAHESATKIEPAEPAVIESRVASATTASRPIEVARVADESAAEQTVAEQTVAEQIVAEHTVAEQRVTEQTVAKQNAAEQIVTEQTVAEQTAAEQIAAEQTVAEQSAAEQSVTEQIVAQPIAAEETAEDQMPAEQTATEIPALENQSVESPKSAASLVDATAVDTHAIEVPDDVAPVSEGPLTAIPQIDFSEPTDDEAAIDRDDDLVAGILGKVGEFMHAAAREDASLVGQDETDENRVVEHVKAESVVGNPDAEGVGELADAENVVEQPEAVSAIEQPEAGSAVEHPEAESVDAAAGAQRDIAAEQAPGLLPIEQVLPEASDVPLLDPLSAEETHSPLELVEERDDAALAVEQAHSEPVVVSTSADERLDDAAIPVEESHPVERPVDRSHERIPWFPRRVPRPSDRPQGSSLALHSGKSAHRLTSANLRLIPGLEYAPLRAEDQGRRMMIAPIMEEPLPDWEPRRRTITVTNAPPLPEYPSVVPDAMTAEAHAAPTASAPDIPDSISLRARGSDDLTVPSPAGAESTDVGVGQMRGSRQPQHIGPTQPSEKASVVGTSTSTAGSAEVETDTSAIDELARRLEGARIAPVGEASSVQRHVFEPSIVSDTLADILVAQGAFGEAMKAFMTLARMRPSQLAYYEERIAEMKRRIVEAGNDDQ